MLCKISKVFEHIKVLNLHNVKPTLVGLVLSANIAWADAFSSKPLCPNKGFELTFRLKTSPLTCVLSA